MTEEARNRLFAELRIRLRDGGFTAREPENGLLPVDWGGKSLCWVSEVGSIRYPAKEIDVPELREQRDRVREAAASVAQYMKFMEQAPALKASGLEGDYRLLSEFNDVVLAGHPSKFGVQFVTWEWINDRTALWQGHYVANNYEAAKQDFAARAGLVQEDRLFSDEQLTELYRRVQETMDSGYPITDERKELLEGVCRQIEYSVPDLDARVMLSNEKEFAAEREQTPSFDMDMGGM